MKVKNQKNIEIWRNFRKSISRKRLLELSLRELKTMIKSNCVPVKSKYVRLSTKLIWQSNIKVLFKGLKGAFLLRFDYRLAAFPLKFEQTLILFTRSDPSRLGRT